MLKRAFLVLLPVATLFSPVVFFRGPEWWSQLTASFSAESSQQDPGAPPEGPKNNKEPFAGSSRESLDGAPVYELAEVLRFDVTPGWVVGRWPRVSAGLAQLQLQGYRVPAGSLTYYFNPRQQVQRITFHGTTGTTEKLVFLLSTQYGFRRRLTNDPGKFLYEKVTRHGKPTSFLWIRSAPVVKASQPLDRYEVALLLERPESG